MQNLTFLKNIIAGLVTSIKGIHFTKTVRQFWLYRIIGKLKTVTFKRKPGSVPAFEFRALYTKLSVAYVIDVLKKTIDLAFKDGKSI